MKIPFVNLTAQYESIKGDIDAAIAGVIGENAFVGGRYVKAFEKEFGELYGARNVISCGNGTDSLYIIMKMLGIGEGDEVITVANSWISSAETITQAGARPVFLDVHPEYYSMNESALVSKISKKTKALIAVHLQGQACEIDIIKSVCDKHGIHLIEDCAQSHFSEYKGRKVGLFGVAGSFSFYPGKNLGAYGDAGCIITNDDQLAEKCMMYARHGALKKHEHKIEGINSRMDGLQAGILSAKLPHILSWTDKRISHAGLYSEYLKDIKGIKTPITRPNTKHTFHLYVIKALRRDKLADFLKSKGIETAIHYPTALPNLQAYQYLHHTMNDFPIASQLQSEILSLPMYAELTEEMIRYVADAVRAYYEQQA